MAKRFPEYDLEDERDEFDRRRLDVVALDGDGDVVVTLEAERANADADRSIPEHYDAMAACDPEEAIWLVMTQEGGHDVLEALNDPHEGPVRVEKTYAETTRVQDVSIDEPGCTDIETLGTLYRAVVE